MKNFTQTNTFKVLKVTVITFFITILVVGVFTMGTGIDFKDMEEVSNTATEFMQLSSEGKIQEAYAMTSKDFQQTNSLEFLQEFNDSNPWLFKDFQNIQTEKFNVESKLGIEGKFYIIAGKTLYTNGDVGVFEFELIEESNLPKILGFELYVDENRYNTFK